MEENITPGIRGRMKRRASLQRDSVESLLENAAQEDIKEQPVKRNLSVARIGNNITSMLPQNMQGGLESPNQKLDLSQRVQRITMTKDDGGTYADDFDEAFSETSDFEELMANRSGRTKSQHEVEKEEEFFTTSGRFKRCTATIIGINVILIACEALWIQKQFAIFDSLELAFTVFYVFELVLCMGEQGCSRFLCTEDWWNVFDLCVTTMCVLDLLCVSDSSSGSSVTRLFRLFRILRVFRALRFVNELDYVLVQITRATCKLAIIASIVLFVSSIITTHMLWDNHDEVVSSMFQDLGVSFWTMFKIMTLDNWGEIVERVIEVKPEMRWFFILFIFTTAISLISLAPAMFIDISLRKIEHEDFVEQERKRYNLIRDKRRLLLTLFRLTDVDDNGTISIDELKGVLTNETTLSELEEAGITNAGDLRDVRLGLFDLWEEHLHKSEGADTELTMEEFTNGLLRMHEDITQAVLWRSTTSTRLMLRDFASVVLEELSQLKDVLHSNYEVGVPVSGPDENGAECGLGSMPLDLYTEHHAEVTAGGVLHSMTRRKRRDIEKELQFGAASSGGSRLSVGSTGSRKNSLASTGSRRLPSQALFSARLNKGLSEGTSAASAGHRGSCDRLESPRGSGTSSDTSKNNTSDKKSSGVSFRRTISKLSAEVRDSLKSQSGAAGQKSPEQTDGEVFDIYRVNSTISAGSAKSVETPVPIIKPPPAVASSRTQAQSNNVAPAKSSSSNDVDRLALRFNGDGEMGARNVTGFTTRLAV